MGVYKHPKVIWMYMQKSTPTYGVHLIWWRRCSGGVWQTPPSLQSLYTSALQVRRRRWGGFFWWNTFFLSLFLVLFEKDQKVFHNSPTPLVAYERLQPLLNPRQSLARTKTRRCAHATSSYVLVRRDDAVIYLYIKTHAGPLMVRAFLNVRATSRSGWPLLCKRGCRDIEFSFGSVSFWKEIEYKPFLVLLE